MKLRKLLFASTLLFVIYGALHAQNTQVIAHRGFWKTDGSAQNSIAALVKADSIHCYGSEFDVWLTADNKLVVDHDGVRNGVRLEASTGKEYTANILDNGENLSTLQQYLDKGKQLKTRLILELKSHKTPERETSAVEQIVKLIKDMGLEERTEYISFSRHACGEFIRLAPKGTPVYYLDGNLTPQELKEMGLAGPDYHHSVFKKHPEWIKQCHELGMKVNVWTVNSQEDMEWLIGQNVDFITTDEPVLLQNILRD
ncbi:glycerophosphodiester phosphodiesterase family protein [Bacteroides sp. UBA939]|uniref:glycerophosphodiester phosphodiesterase family protein n=1 Tax=Bacteroides sp. UBA939 TaxID=1946092 RepID=UPI0025BED896|nr:glycerophosphodiester phosphodiesterase family protein [Bacteroides sp. UBA939]